mmetsp:Transcript_2052/g.5472  ORF Transcript_2052/g.5472 Transcript_2052/m.5472 type:complete len:266 (+) Transcript_2052:453-1250(+)
MHANNHVEQRRERVFEHKTLELVLVRVRKTHRNRASKRLAVRPQLALVDVCPRLDVRKRALRVDHHTRLGRLPLRVSKAAVRYEQHVAADRVDELFDFLQTKRRVFVASVKVEHSRHGRVLCWVCTHPKHPTADLHAVARHELDIIVTGKPMHVRPALAHAGRLVHEAVLDADQNEQNDSERGDGAPAEHKRELQRGALERALAKQGGAVASATFARVVQNGHASLRRRLLLRNVVQIQRRRQSDCDRRRRRARRHLDRSVSLPP